MSVNERSRQEVASWTSERGGINEEKVHSGMKKKGVADFREVLRLIESGDDSREDASERVI